MMMMTNKNVDTLHIINHVLLITGDIKHKL